MTNWYGKDFQNQEWDAQFSFESLLFFWESHARSIKCNVWLGNYSCGVHWTIHEKITLVGLRVFKLACSLTENWHKSVRAKGKVCKTHILLEKQESDRISYLSIGVEINHQFLQCLFALFCPFSPLLCLTAPPLQYHCAFFVSSSSVPAGVFFPVVSVLFLFGGVFFCFTSVTQRSLPLYFPNPSQNCIHFYD